MLDLLNIVLGILLAIAAACAIAMDVDHTKPNVEFLPEMKRSPASAAFSANAVLPEGRTLQAPVAGSSCRFARFSNAGTLWLINATWAAKSLDLPLSMLAVSTALYRL